MNKTAILVQARMSSSRCPGKVLADLNGKPLIGRLLESLTRNNLGVPVIFCTSNEASDDPVAEFCQKNEVLFFRGSLKDVAHRFIEAAEYFNLQHLVRISGDSPWFNVELLNLALKTYFRTKPDICCNICPRSFPKGQSLEVFSTTLLKKFYPDMTSSDREHVTPIFYRHAELLKIENLTHMPKLDHADLSIDTKEQLSTSQNLFKNLDKAHWEYSIDELLDLFSLKP